MPDPVQWLDQLSMTDMPIPSLPQSKSFGLRPPAAGHGGLLSLFLCNVRNTPGALITTSYLLAFRNGIFQRRKLPWLREPGGWTTIPCSPAGQPKPGPGPACSQEPGDRPARSSAPSGLAPARKMTSRFPALQPLALALARSGESKICSASAFERRIKCLETRRCERRAESRTAPRAARAVCSLRTNVCLPSCLNCVHVCTMTWIPGLPFGRGPTRRHGLAATTAHRLPLATRPCCLQPIDAWKPIAL